MDCPTSACLPDESQVDNILSALPANFTLQDIEDVILNEVQRIIDVYGEQAAEEAFRCLLGEEYDTLIPGDPFDTDKPSIPVQEGLKVISERDGLVKKIGDFIRKKVLGRGAKKAGGKAAAATAGTGLGMAGTGLAAAGGAAAADAATSWIDKDVDIANVSTTDKLGVTIERGSAPWLEALIGRTNELLQDLTELLSQSQPAISDGLNSLGRDLHDILAVQTDKTSGEIKSKQGMKQKIDTDKKSKAKTPGTGAFADIGKDTANKVADLAS